MLSFGLEWSSSLEPKPVALLGTEPSEQLRWFDIGEIGDDEARALEDRWSVHPMVVSACTEFNVQRAKAERFGEMLFLALQGIDYASQNDRLETTFIYLVVGKGLLVSVHPTELHAVAAVKASVERMASDRPTSAPMLAHALVGGLVDNIAPAVELLSDALEAVEEEAIRNPGHETLESLLKFKRTAQHLQRSLRPQREVVSRLARGEFALIDEEARHHFQGTYESMAFLDESLTSIRERIESALSMYLSSLANKQNELMRVLSIVAAVFLPLGLLAGVYGMNFENMPELSSPYGYYIVLALIVTASASILWWIWGVKFLRQGQRTVMLLTPAMVKPRRLAGSTVGAAGRTVVRRTRNRS